MRRQALLGVARRIAVRVGVGIAMATGVVEARAAHAAAAAAPAPARIVIVAGECPSRTVDASALAAALRVEMIQEGVFSVDVAAAGSTAVRDAAVATVRLLPSSCGTGEAAGVEIANGATGRSVRSVLSLAGLEPAMRARVAALVISERLRASWPTLILSTAPTGPAVDAAEASDAGREASAENAAPAPSALQAPPAAPPALDVADPPLTSSSPTSFEAPPRGDRAGDRPALREHGAASNPEPRRLDVGAALEGRSFLSEKTGLLGPRALGVLRGWPSPVLRVQVDAGVDWGAAHDALGDVSLILASVGVGLAATATRGPVHGALGTRAEFGWTTVRGLPSSSASARGSSASVPTVATSVVASLEVDVVRHWAASASADVGYAWAGVEAQADGRAVASTAGWMVGARAGVVYAF